MSDAHTGDDARARAEELVRTIVADGGRVSAVDREAVVDALTRDLRAASDKATTDEERLVKIETQTRVLAEAIVAITDAAEGVAPAVQAVKAEM